MLPCYHGRGRKVKRNLREGICFFTCTRRKGTRIFLSPQLLLFCVHLAAWDALGRTGITALQCPCSETVRKVKQTLSIGYGHTERQGGDPGVLFLFPKHTGPAHGAKEGLHPVQICRKSRRSSKPHTLSSLCAGLQLYQLLAWASWAHRSAVLAMDGLLISPSLAFVHCS